jgi:hypothetical protein
LRPCHTTTTLVSRTGETGSGRMAKQEEREGDAKDRAINIRSVSSMANCLLYENQNPLNSPPPLLQPHCCQANFDIEQQIAYYSLGSFGLLARHFLLIIYALWRLMRSLRNPTTSYTLARPTFHCWILNLTSCRTAIVRASAGTVNPNTELPVRRHVRKRI